ncbi:MAG: hypothetical protein R6U17_07500 [Thermoplasmata archaeon]
MVRKPSEGICGACGSEELEFFDDGSGRCTECQRTFKWKDNPKYTEKKKGSSAGNKKRVLSARGKAVSFSGEKYTVYQNVLIIGFFLLIAGYSLMFSMHAASDWAEDPIEFASTMVIFSLLLINVGIVIVGLGLVLGAVKADHLSEDIRAWMFMAMAILLGVFLGLGNFLSIVDLL